MSNSFPTPGPRPGATPGPTQSPMPQAPIAPEQLRNDVAEVLDRPAPTPADHAALMEEAHELLQQALSKGNGGARG
ncbi:MULTISPECIES: hypothetical protein [unclassified Corynebacterium]|uniref:hypothetical protein n=1 Tax=unclassified Corynebacterium TaxID=2624378 RepID=UPI0030A91552